VDILDEILRAKRDEVERLHEPTVREALRRAALAAGPPRDFSGALRRAEGAVAVIAEIKRRSPSKGVLAAELDAGVTARLYEDGGSAALSVLTDGPYFGGSAADLHAARSASGLPVLRKDFTIDEAQLDEARGMGADAVLLIVRAFSDDGRLRALHEQAQARGLSILVEAHDEAEIERAADVGADIVGVNARDLASFAEDLDRVATLRPLVPDHVIAVAESAIRSAGDVARMAEAGFDAVLVGEALVRAGRPDEILRTLTKVPRRVR
jgi:indole-3-glycerol phosphate synthase